MVTLEGVTAAHDDDEDLHRLLDRLPPAQVRRLRALVEADPELARYASTEPDAVPPGGGALLGFLGSFESGRGDLGERHEEIIREGLDRPA